MNGTIDIGDFVMVNSYIVQVYAPLNFLGTFWRFIRQALVDVEQIFELLEVDEQIKEVDNPLPLVPTKNADIIFENVSFSYDKDRSKEDRDMILDNISFTVPAGQSVALVGATGSGKSTIMRLLYRFYEVDEGKVIVNGQDISKLTLYDLRSQIAIVPQDCVLFNDTLRYNISYGGVSDKGIKDLIDNCDTDDEKMKEIMRRIEIVAQKSQISGFVANKADKYETKVGERGLKLSGGEKQRVAIARALLKNTPIMCFDEATSALDTQTEKEIQVINLTNY
jgi:ABC-type multidrug transport system fused ATPase/permease subunit